MSKYDKLWEILVPSVNNQGHEFSTEWHRYWDEKVREIAGGLMIMSRIKGQWENHNGQVFHERVIPVRIACTESELERIMKMTIGHYEQEAVMAYKISDVVYIHTK